MDDPDTTGIGPEGLDHLAGDEGRVGVDPRPATEGAPDQARVGERRLVAELGMVQRGEIVHGNHGGGTAGRRHQEVRPVHDVGGPDEPLQWWRIPAAPQRVEGPGRHRPLPGGDAWGQLRLDQPASTPAHGIGPDVEAGALRQGRQGAPAERTDAGGEPEQRRCVERNAQGCPLRRPGRADGAQVVIAPSMERIAPDT